VKPPSDLFGRPLFLQLSGDILFQLQVAHLGRLPASFTSLIRETLSLLGSIAAASSIAIQFAPYRTAISAKYLGNLCLRFRRLVHSV